METTVEFSVNIGEQDVLPYTTKNYGPSVPAYSAATYAKGAQLALPAAMATEFISRSWATEV